MDELTHEKPTKEQLLKLKAYIEESEDNIAFIDGPLGGKIDEICIYDHDLNDDIDIDLYVRENDKHEPMIVCFDLQELDTHDPLSLVTEVDINSLEFYRKEKLKSPLS